MHSSLYHGQIMT